ncbi:MAG: tyrosine-type recombinase/integrase [Polyangiaceae bacterium]
MRRRSPIRQVKRGDTTRLVIDFFYLDEHGKRQRFRRDASVQTMTAARAEAQRLMELAARTGSPFASTKEAPTLASFVETTYRPLFMPQLRPGTRSRYEGLFQTGLLAAFGKLRLDQIHYKVVLAFANELRARPRVRPLRGKRRGIQPRGHVNLLKSVLRAAVQAGELSDMPKLPSFAMPKKLPAAPDQGHVAALLDGAPGWLRLAVALQSLAGLRQGEVRALQVGDLDLEQRLLFVRRTFSDDTLVPPKGGAERVVPLIPELVELLRQAIRGRPATAFVVVDEEGSVIKRQTVLARLKALQKKAGLRDWGSHSLRHFFCSELLRRGASLEAARVLLGHSGVKTTQLYAHATRQDLHDAVGRLRPPARTGTDR